MTAHGRTWTLVHVEDDKDILRQVKEFLEGESFPFGTLRVVASERFEDALERLREHKVDVVVLDVFRGKTERGDRAGMDLLKHWQSIGFAPVVIYTALPEGLEESSSPFVRVVGKEPGSLERLANEITELFNLKIPQIHRAMVQHLDNSLKEYMWGFVVDEWDRIKDLVTNPDFVRLLLRRLALGFGHGVEPLLEELYPGTTASRPAEDTIHPVEYYVKPPIANDPQLGDLRRLSEQGSLYMVIWPSCDLIEARCKVDRVLCARTRPLEEFEEFEKWSDEPNPGQKLEGMLIALIRNNRKTGQSERYHFLPPAWNIPALVVDFAELEHVPVADLRAAHCECTVASPFAESIATRFVRYVGRLGTPDLDPELILKTLRERRAAP